MVKSAYIPDRGDLVWLNFDQQSGHEQKGKRPAIVISPMIYNQKSGLALFCPITNQIKGYPFEVILQDIKKLKGAVLSDQVKSLDWMARNARFIQKASKDVIDEVISKLGVLIH